VLVLNNRDLNFVTWEQHGKGDPKNEVSQALPGFAYAEYAHMLGLEGIRIDYPGQIASALDAALAAERPCVVEILAAATAHNAHAGRKVLCCDRQWRPRRRCCARRGIAAERLDDVAPEPSVSILLISSTPRRRGYHTRETKGAVMTKATNRPTPTNRSGRHTISRKGTRSVVCRCGWCG
jgi:hypothetical protein